ncbi:MAG: vWA domain-containing protein, partial [Planctomycetota bacterium]
MKPTVLLCALLAVSGCGEVQRAREAGSVDASAAYDESAAFEPLGQISAESDSGSEFNTESYDTIVENQYQSPLDEPLSTFSIDVDTASYANVRRFLRDGTLPPAGAVRIEELINYFDYDYPQPDGSHPFAVNIEAATCPWRREHLLARIGLKGVEVDRSERPDANLVFLLDVSGSMNQPNKLPLVKSSMRMLVEQLRPTDRVAIVVYAGASGLVLPSTPVSDELQILNALERLKAGGSTNGGEGIQLAYNVAESNLIPQGINRVILCSDGDFNVGITNRSRLVSLIQNEAQRDVFLSIFGFGTGNLKDATMEELSNKGNGTYGYIDSLAEARKVFVEESLGMLMTIAKDVKIQVDFNPIHVQAYRLIGYENRVMEAQDFRDDRKDAGEIGSGHTVTALYEIVPHGVENPVVAVEPSKYQAVNIELDSSNNEMLTVRLRYKRPDGDQGIEFHVPASQPAAESDGSADFQFAASVALFGMLLRESEYAGDADWHLVESLASAGLEDRLGGDRAEFQDLVRIAAQLGKREIAG